MASAHLTREEIEQLDSIWKAPGFVPTLVAVAAAFGAWALLLPVLPVAVLDSGGDPALAGATTGVFMAATVLTQIFTPWMLRTVGYNPVMVVSAFLLGVPALGHMISMDAAVVLFFSALRGVGFGAITVAESALMAELVPVRFLGKATGLLGVFIGVAQMVFLPVGLAMVAPFGYNSVYILGAAIALVAAAMCLRIPRLKAAPAEPRARGRDDQDSDRARRAPMWRLVAVPALALTTLSMSFGAISSFLPASIREMDPAAGAVLGGIILSVTGAASMVVRYVVGVIADKRGEPGATMIPAQIAALAGVALIVAVMVAELPVGWMLLAAVLFGGGFGAVQNESLLTMFHRLQRSQVSQASAVWNIFYDSGTGLGSTVYGVIVAASGYPGAFATGAVVIAGGIGMTLLDRFVGARRIAEHDNIKARLKSVRAKGPGDRR